MKQYRIRTQYEAERTGVVLDSETGVSVAAHADDCVLSPSDPYYELAHSKGTGLGSLSVSVTNTQDHTA
jgi:hypothetical protein